MKIISINGFKKEYLKYAPYLKRLTKDCLNGTLEPSYSFTKNSASFFTGKNPDKHNIFTKFKFSKKHTTPNLPNPILTLSKNTLRFIKNERFFYRHYKIPDYALEYFKPTLTKEWYQKKSINTKTIFDYLRENRISFSYINFPNFYNKKDGIYLDRSDEGTLKKSNQANSRVQFIFLNELDSISEKYGPNSEEVEKHIRKLDRLFSRVRDEFIIYSEHGYFNVSGTINILGNLDRLKIDYGKDFAYFIEPTIARFWFKNELVEKKVKDQIAKLKNCKIKTEKDLKKYNAPKKQSLLLACDPGYMFFPNFYHEYNQVMGIQGYSPKLKEQKGFYLISNKKGKKKNGRVIDLLPTILKLLKIKKTEKLDGEPLF